MIGNRYGNWEVLGPAPGRYMLFCKCACGTEKSIYKYNLTRGLTSSCGCIGSPGPVTHGLAGTPEHNIWSTMKARCSNPNNGSYKDYGGRGIKVCQRWAESFEAFFADLGPRPSPEHSIEREKSNGDYEPANCRWATHTEQMRNTRRTKLVSIGGVEKTVPEWAEIYDIPKFLIYARLTQGISPEDAVSTRSRLPRRASAEMQ